MQSSDDLIYRKYRYIVFDINICIVSSKKYQIFQYIVISFIYSDIFDISRYFMPEVYIFITALLK